MTQILAMNRQLTLGRFAMEAAKTMHVNFFATLRPATLLAVAQPGDEEGHGVADDHPSPGRRKPSHRRAARLRDAPAPARPRALVARRLSAADPGFSHDRLVDGHQRRPGDRRATQRHRRGPAVRRILRRTGGRPDAGLDRLASSAHLWWLLLLLPALAVVMIVLGLWVVAFDLRRIGGRGVRDLPPKTAAR